MTRAAAGYGARVGQETFGAFLATGLSTLAHRPVRLRSLAVVGAQTTDLDGQIPLAMPHDPDVVALIIGVNDVTHRVRPSTSVAALRAAVTQLRESGTPGSTRRRPREVVVGTCPDLGTVQPLPPPLRQIARRWSRRLAAAQTIACVESGGHSVSLGSLLGPHFAAAPHVMFGPDRFHPSPAGYRSVRHGDAADSSRTRSAYSPRTARSRRRSGWRASSPSPGRPSLRPSTPARRSRRPGWAARTGLPRGVVPCCCAAVGVAIPAVGRVTPEHPEMLADTSSGR